MIEINSTFFAESITFVLLILITAKFIWPKVDAILEKRRKYIEESIIKVSQERDRSSREKEHILSLKKQNDLLVSDLISQTKKEMEHLKTGCIESMRQQTIQHQLNLERERKIFLASLKEQYKDDIAACAIKIIEQAVHKSLTQEEQSELIDNIIAQL